MISFGCIVSIQRRMLPGENAGSSVSTVMTTKHCSRVARNVSAACDLLQHLRVNITAADNCDIHGGSWQLLLVEQKSGHCHGTAGFSYGFWIRRQPLHGLPDFEFTDR